MNEVVITFANGKEVIVPRTAVANHRKVHGKNIQSIRPHGTPVVPAAVVVEAAVKLPSSLDDGNTVGKATEIINKLDNIADVETYTKGDSRKGILKAVKERIEELTKS